MIIPCLVHLNDLIVYYIVSNVSHFRSNFFNFRAIFVHLLSIFRAQFQHFRCTICRILFPRYRRIRKRTQLPVDPQNGRHYKCERAMHYLTRSYLDNPAETTSSALRDGGFDFWCCPSSSSLLRSSLGSFFREFLDCDIFSWPALS